MSGITELAKLLKERENKSDYSPLFGTIIELPDIKIRIGDRIVLTADHLSMCVSVDAKDENGRFLYVGRQAVLLPFAEGQKFILIGLVL